MKKGNQSPHTGHRERMRQQFLENGLSRFNDHQQLELLLFNVIPQKDTNELAHRLLDECGGRLCDVLDSPYSKLISIKGIGVKAAAFLKLIPQICSQYLTSKQLIGNSYLMKEMQSVCDYFEGVFTGVMKEEIHAAAVSSDLRLIREKKIADGTIDAVGFSPRILMDFVVESGCSRVIIAHNHPRGRCSVSSADYHSTRDLVELFRRFDVEIVDHIVVGNGGSQSMRASLSTSRIWKPEL